MTDFTRFAVYLAPEPGPLADFGSSWLGWDAAKGQKVAHPDLPGLPQPVAALTGTPRKYGFHGTIKPPFALAEGTTPTDLQTELAALTARLAPIRLAGLELTALGRFLALTVTGNAAPLADMAAAVVRTIDPFRAPASAAELARRRKAQLSARQDELLGLWGYPYVMDEFRFHMTLTNRMPKPDLTATRQALAPVLTPLLPCPFHVRDLCLFGEATDGRFHLISRHALTG